MKTINKSNKKVMFWVLVIINLIASISDLTFTFIGSPDLSREANPLVYALGLSWNALIISSIIFFVVIVILLYYNFFRLKRIVIKCDGFKQYLSMLFFNCPDKFIWTLYKFPKNKIGYYYFGACLGFVLAIIIPVFKLFAVILWIGIIKDIEIINAFNEYFYFLLTPLGSRTEFIICSVFLGLCIWYYWFFKEYKINKKALENGIK
jgi:uncharacterized membrane protein